MTAPTRAPMVGIPSLSQLRAAGATMNIASAGTRTRKYLCERSGRASSGVRRRKTPVTSQGPSCR